MVMYYINHDSFISSFSNFMLFYFLICHLVVQVRTFSTRLTEVVRVNITCIFPILVEKCSVIVKYNISGTFCIDASYNIEKFFFYF